MLRMDFVEDVELILGQVGIQQSQYEIALSRPRSDKFMTLMATQTLAKPPSNPSHKPNNPTPKPHDQVAPVPTSQLFHHLTHLTISYLLFSLMYMQFECTATMVNMRPGFTCYQPRHPQYLPPLTHQIKISNEPPSHTYPT